jgi:hypothetical protein
VKSLLTSLFVALLTFSAMNCDALAQPSLKEGDVNAVVLELSTGEKVTFDVYRDGNESSRFFYMPRTVRVFENMVGEKKVPEFTLVRYDLGTEANPLTGGILQFSATIGATAEEIDGMRKKIPGTFGLAQDATFTLSSIPVKSAEAAIYAAEGVLISKVYGSGSAPLSATQKMIFQLDLTGAGTDVFTALTSGKTGVGVTFTVEFLGLTPEAQIEIIADYRQIRNHYSENKKTKTAAAACGWTGKVSASANWQKDFAEVRNILQTSGALKVTLTGTETYTSKELNELIAPVLARINTQILEIEKAPEKIDPAIAKDPEAKAEATGWGVAFARGESIAVKKVEDVKDFKEKINMNFRDVAPRKTVVGGFVGIGRYDEETRKQLFITASKSFPAAVLTLPIISETEFSSLQCTSWITAPNVPNRFYSKVHNWSKGNWNLAGEPNTKDVNFGRFQFTSLPADLAGKDWKTFTMHYELTAKTNSGQPLTTTSSFPVLDGTGAIATIDEKAFPHFTLNWIALQPWGNPAQQMDGDVVFSTYTCTQDGQKLASGSVTPVKTESGSFEYPQPKTVYFAANGGAVTVSATLGIKKDGAIAVKTFSSTIERNLVRDQFFTLDQFNSK